jgi:hypothetical protein
MRLEGGERLVLKTLADLQGDSIDDVDDSRLAAAARMFVPDVRDWLETLEGKGLVERTRLTGGFSAHITAKGKQALRLAEPIVDPQPGPTAARSGASILAPSSGVAPLPAQPPRSTPQKSSQPSRKILILAANPKNTERLRLDEEVKEVTQALKRSLERDQFPLIVEWAVTDDELRRALLDHEPEIVHFSGHGTGAGSGDGGRELVPAGNDEEGGLAFEDGRGHVRLISGEPLSRLFALCAHTVKCVVLNACYSEAQADAIARHIEFVIGMKKAIGDDAAIKFAVGFYDALGAGRDFETAFKWGCIAIDLTGLPDYMTPVMTKKTAQHEFRAGVEPSPPTSV